MNTFFTAPKFTTLTPFGDISRHVPGMTSEVLAGLPLNEFKIEVEEGVVHWSQNNSLGVFDKRNVSSLRIGHINYGDEKFATIDLEFSKLKDCVRYMVIVTHIENERWLVDISRQIASIIGVPVFTDE